jgi:hypothetical protein
MEVFLNNQSEFIVHLTFLRILFPFVNIHNVPLLVKTIVSGVHTNVSVFLVNITYNLNYFTSFVDNIVILESEHLPPSRICCCASQVVWSSVSLDVKWMRFPVVVSDSLGYSIKVPLLSSDILSPSLEPDVISTMAFSNSLQWKSWSNVEWSVDMESKLLIKTFSWLFCGLVNIDNFPFLLDWTILGTDVDLDTFSRLISSINSISILLVDELLISVDEISPPSCEFGVHVMSYRNHICPSSLGIHL